MVLGRAQRASIRALAKVGDELRGACVFATAGLAGQDARGRLDGGASQGFGRSAQQVGVLGGDQASATEQESTIAIVRKLVGGVGRVAQQVTHGVVVLATRESIERTWPGGVRTCAVSHGAPTGTARAVEGSRTGSARARVPVFAADRAVTSDQRRERESHAGDQPREGRRAHDGLLNISHRGHLPTVPTPKGDGPRRGANDQHGPKRRPLRWKKGLNAQTQRRLPRTFVHNPARRLLTNSGRVAC